MKRNNLQHYGWAGFVALILLTPGSVPAAIDRDHGGFHDRETKEWATPEESMRQAAIEKKAEKKEAEAQAQAKADARKADAETEAARRQLDEGRLKAEK